MEMPGDYENCPARLPLLLLGLKMMLDAEIKNIITMEKVIKICVTGQLTGFWFFNADICGRAIGQIFQ
jgi:hypothetical protein